MPTYKGVEVWIEDSEYRKLNHREVTINLIDDRTVSAKSEMAKNELYTVHCLSPISVFCDVFIVTAARSRKLAARFHLDESLAISDYAYGSSANHTEGRFRDHGLRTPCKRQAHHDSNLCSVEVEIRRIGQILKGEPLEECEVNGNEDVVIEFSMIDDFDRPPWLMFHFDISAKESRAAILAPTTEHIRKRVPHRTIKSQATNRNKSGIFSPEEPSNKTSRKASHGYLHGPRERRRKHDGCDGSASVGEGLISTTDLLHEEYQKEEAEEQRLLRKLQEQVQTKKTRNMELRRLLGETP